MPEPVAPPETPTETPPAAGPPAAPVETPAPPVETPPTDVASLPDWAQKVIRETREEAATNRTKVRELTDAQQASMDAIAKALGLKPEDDPAKAAQTAAAERDTERAARAELAIENAVLRMAHKNAADPEALTDSRSFMAKMATLDPAADDFAAKVDAAIAAAVEANPALKNGNAAPAAPPARSGGPVGGGTVPAGQLSEDDLKGMTPAEIVKAQEGRPPRMPSFQRRVEE